LAGRGDAVACPSRSARGGERRKAHHWSRAGEDAARAWRSALAFRRSTVASSARRLPRLRPRAALCGDGAVSSRHLRASFPHRVVALGSLGRPGAGRRQRAPRGQVVVPGGRSPGASRVPADEAGPRAPHRPRPGFPEASAIGLRAESPALPSDPLHPPNVTGRRPSASGVRGL
jgi:hypothetical protein